MHDEGSRVVVSTGAAAALCMPLGTGVTYRLNLLRVRDSRATTGTNGLLETGGLDDRILLGLIEGSTLGEDEGCRDNVP
jgi:hypothetical protein